MPTGYPGTGVKRPKLFAGRTIARDLVQDLHNRIVTPYDARTILKMLEPGDRFSIILPRELVSEVKVDYDLEPMEIADQLEDPELDRKANMYRQSHAVIIKNAA